MIEPTAYRTAAANNAPSIVDTRELVRRHLQDPTHVFTDEEISAVDVSADHIDVSGHPLLVAFQPKRKQ